MERLSMPMSISMVSLGLRDYMKVIMGLYRGYIRVIGGIKG